MQSKVIFIETRPDAVVMNGCTTIAATGIHIEMDTIFAAEFIHMGRGPLQAPGPQLRTDQIFGFAGGPRLQHQNLLSRCRQASRVNHGDSAGADDDCVYFIHTGALHHFDSGSI